MCIWFSNTDLFWHRKHDQRLHVYVVERIAKSPYCNFDHRKKPKYPQLELHATKNMVPSLVSPVWTCGHNITNIQTDLQSPTEGGPLFFLILHTDSSHHQSGISRWHGESNQSWWSLDCSWYIPHQSVTEMSTSWESWPGQGGSCQGSQHGTGISKEMGCWDSHIQV